MQSARAGLRVSAGGRPSQSRNSRPPPETRKSSLKIGLGGNGWTRGRAAQARRPRAKTATGALAPARPTGRTDPRSRANIHISSRARRVNGRNLKSIAPLDFGVGVLPKVRDQPQGADRSTTHVQALCAGMLKLERCNHAATRSCERQCLLKRYGQSSGLCDGFFNPVSDRAEMATVWGGPSARRPSTLIAGRLLGAQME